MALTRLASAARHVGVDLWSYAGGSLARAVDFLIPAATRGHTAWPYQELSFHAYAAIDVIHAAAAGNRTAGRALPTVLPPPGGDLWPVRPAAEDLG